ncbi:hypothetical protein QBC37DRAFT_387589 [Rhypophila decipiens]|uniref:Uncharacterized protein n=1 Tax=Rhypophila decipiens TaxID=261697 RepID=A0AAN7B855_9PEZI|nr:hypothetical protein QBC37DRAFT_387589 [Rhypophila decipiens]
MSGYNPLNNFSLFLLLLASALFGLVKADTLQVNVLSQSQGGCTGGPIIQQSFTIGKIGPCHATSKPFLTVTTTNVAQSFFGRNLRVLSYEGRSCSGNPVMQNKLSNTDINCCDSTLTEYCHCHAFGLCDGRLMQSFKVDTYVEPSLRMPRDSGHVVWN